MNLHKLKSISIGLCFLAFGASKAQYIDFTNPTPYKSSTEVVKINNVGVYPNIKDVPNWNGERPGKYSLKFKINGLSKGDEVYLADNYNGSKYLRDTTVVDKKGIAEFTGDILLQRGIYLFVFPKKQGYFEFIVADDLDFQIETDTSYYENLFYENMKVSGSVENTVFAIYQKEKIIVAQNLMKVDRELADSTISDKKREELNTQKTLIVTNKNNADRKYINENPTHLLSRFLTAMIDIEVPKELPIGKDGKADSTYPYKYYRDHYFDNVDFAEDGLMRMPIHIVKQKLDFYWDKVQILQPDTAFLAAKRIIDQAYNTVDLERFLIWYHINKFETSNIMGLDKAFVNLGKVTYLKGKAWWADSSTIGSIGKNVIERGGSLIGNKGADLMLQTFNKEIAEKKGSPWMRLYEMPAKYKIMIFWDPTCGHCKEVVPKLAKIYNKNMDKDWMVIGLTQSDKTKEFDEFMKAHPEVQNWIHLDRSAAPSDVFAKNLKKYYVIASPTIFILDENNIIKANRMDVEKIEEFIEQLEKIKEFEEASKKITPNNGESELDLKNN